MFSFSSSSANLYVRSKSLKGLSKTVIDNFPYFSLLPLSSRLLTLLIPYHRRGILPRFFFVKGIMVNIETVLFFTPL